MDNGPNLGDMQENTPPAPQLVMLANVAAADGGGGDATLDQKEMMELKTVGSSYLDSDEDNSSR